MRWIAAILVCVMGMAVMSAAAQTRSDKPSFDVVSIKPTIGPPVPSGGVPFVAKLTPTGRRLAARYSNLRALLRYAFGSEAKPLDNSQILGGPDWMDSYRFDLDSRAPDGSDPIPDGEMRLMVQSLLEDRFNLKVHRETREMPVYNLVVARSGLKKLHLSEDQSPPAPIQNTGQRGFSYDASGQQSRGTFALRSTTEGIIQSWRAVPMSTFVDRFQSRADRPVVDKTGLNGLVDAEVLLRWDDSPPAVGAAGSFILEDELGLKLESSRDTFDVLVIDSVSKPSEN